MRARLSRRGRWGGERPRPTATVGRPPYAGAGVAWVGGEPRGAPRTREAGGGAAPLPLRSPRAAGRRSLRSQVWRGAGRGRRQGCGSLCVTQHRLTRWGRGSAARGWRRSAWAGRFHSACQQLRPPTQQQARLRVPSHREAPGTRRREGFPQACGARLRAEAGEGTPDGERVGPNLYLPAAPGFSAVMT